MAYHIKTTPAVGGSQTEISSIVQWPSIQLTLVTTKQVSQLTFNVQNTNSRTLPAVGDTIDVYDGSTHIFGGRVTERELNIDGGLLSTYAFTCVDWSFNFDSKVVVKSYTNMDPGAIVADIIANFTTGFTGVNVQTAGFTIPSIKFNYQPPTKCLQKLATLIGWDWYIDPAKDVHFFNSETNPAPFALTDTDGFAIFNTIDLQTSIQNLKNSVFVIGGFFSNVYSAATTPDVYTTVAATVIYPLAYSYDPTTVAAKLSGSTLTIGIDQKDNPASFQALYNPGQGNVGAFLRLTSDPGSGHPLIVFGSAQIPVLAHTTNSASISTYGEFQDAVVDNQITSIAEAQARAQAEIEQYGTPAIQLQFSTYATGLMIGQTISFQSTILGVATEFFTITQINVSAFSHDTLRYDVTGQLTQNVSFIDIMTLLLEAELIQNPVPDSTVLETLLSLTENITLSDSVTTASSSPPYVWGTFVWGFASWGP